MARRGYSLRASADRVIDELGIREAARKGLFESGEVLRDRWNRKYKEPGSGKVYGRDLTFRTINGRVVPMSRERLGMQKRTAPHPASAPGEPPATDTGGGQRVHMEGLPEGEKARVGLGERHLAILEFGVDDHPGGITIAPRPAARPAKEEAVPEMNERMRVNLQRVGVRLTGGFQTRSR